MGKPGPKRKPRPIEEFALPGQTLPLRTGDQYVKRYYVEEEEADGVLAEQRRQVGSPQTADYLSYEQMMLRISREIVNVNGVPDGRLFQGIYRRAYGGPRDRPSTNRRGDD